MAKTSCVRSTAAQILSRVIDQGVSLNSALSELTSAIEERDRPLLAQLCYGTLRFYPRYEQVVAELLSKPLKRKDGDIACLLILGCYQLEGMRIPDHAAISATVEACKNLQKPWAKGLINAVLREFQRSGQVLQAELPYYAADAHPQWLAGKLKKAWPDHYSDIIAANNGHPPQCLRVNQQHHSRDEYLAQLTTSDIGAQACEFAQSGIRLEQPVDVTQLPGFAEGWCSVQDESAQLAGQLLDLEAGMSVLDACAAPGGKTGHLLEQQPDIDLLALDSSETRLGRVAENLERLELSAELICGDASTPAGWWNEQAFDRILLDAPCSGTGVVRRHPDIKVLRRPEDIPQLAALQLSILEALWRCLKPGGKLLYATCSALPAENSQVIKAFLQGREDAELILLDYPWGIDVQYGRQILSKVDGPDGFFYSLLVKPEIGNEK